MGAPKYARFSVDFDEWFLQGLYLVGEITAVTEYQSQEDKARNRPVRPRVDEVTGRPLFRGNLRGSFGGEGPGEVGHRGVRLCASTGPAGGGAWCAVSAGGAGGHERPAACGGLRAGQVDHLDDPSHRHETTQHRFEQRERSKQVDTGQVRDRPGRHGGEGRSMTNPDLPAGGSADRIPPQPGSVPAQGVFGQGHPVRSGRRKTIPTSMAPA